MLEIDSVSLTYWDKNILSGCYLQCAPGEITGLLGRNGSGKSSLLKIIFGSVKADFKHLKINGRLIKTGFKSGLVSYLPQDPFLPPFIEVNDILEKYSKAYTCSIDKSITDKIAGHKVSELSGGELKLAGLLWVLNLNKPYILLDEPFSGIAPLYIEVIQAIIRYEGKTKGIILTDHMYRSLMEISSRVVLLHNKAVYPITEETDLIRYNYIPDYL